MSDTNIGPESVAYYEQKVAELEKSERKGGRLGGVGSLVAGIAILIGCWAALTYARVNFVWGWIGGAVLILGGIGAIATGSSKDSGALSAARANLDQARAAAAAAGTADHQS